MCVYHNSCLMCRFPDEPERPKTHCQHHRDSVQTTSPEGYPLLGVFVPECDSYGQYRPQQVVVWLNSSSHMLSIQHLTVTILMSPAVSWLYWTLLVCGQYWTRESRDQVRPWNTVCGL